MRFWGKALDVDADAEDITRVQTSSLDKKNAAALSRENKGDVDVGKRLLFEDGPFRRRKSARDEMRDMMMIFGEKS